MRIRRIEVNFAAPVELSDEQARAVHEIVSDLCAATETPETVHWPSSVGSKPLWREPLEPTWDDSVYYIATCARERQASELYAPRRVGRSALVRALRWLRRMGATLREDRALAEAMCRKLEGHAADIGAMQYVEVAAWRAAHPAPRARPKAAGL